MPLSAYILLGVCLSVIGIILYIPVRLLAKRKLENSKPGNGLQLQVTSAGFAFAALMVFLLVLGFAQEHFAPQTAFGKFIGTGMGKLSFSAAVVAAISVFGMILEVMGFELFRNSDKDE